MPDPSVTRHHHGHPKRQCNPWRSEVWRDIQAKGRKLSSIWSLRDKLKRELIARWRFKKDRDKTWTGSKCCRKEKRGIRARPKVAQATTVNQAKAPERGGKS